MNTIKLHLAFVAGLTVALVSADTGIKAESASSQKLTRAELIARAKARRAEAQKRLGGYLYAPSTGKVIRVYNLQKTVSHADITDISNKMLSHLGFQIEVCDSIPTDGRTAAKIELTENNTDPTLLIAPEDSFGRLNVTRLALDNPSRKKLNQRFTKEFWRVLCMTLGCYKSNYTPCVMGNIYSLADLDSNPSLMPNPEVYDKVQSTCQRLGIDMLRKVSYKKACIEGWAPAPTNDIQKAIWEQVKADKERGPTNPIKIPPPLKRK